MNSTSFNGEKKMTKKEFVDALQVRLSENGITMNKKDTEKAAETVFNAIRETTAADGEFSWPGFGKFKLRTRGARKARNPRTGETVDVPEKQVVVFGAAPDFLTLA